MLPDLEKLRRHVQQRLSPDRYTHSRAVQKQAMALAKRHGADWYKAGVAGLLHDICKDMDRDALLNYLRSCDILLDVLTMGNPSIWHAVAGAAYVREVLGIRDPEILGAIRYHTTARRAMSLLEQVVFVADLTSEDRNYPDVSHMRRLSEQSLDSAVFYAVRHAVISLVREGRPLTGETWDAYNYYLPEDGDLPLERSRGHDLV